MSCPVYWEKVSDAILFDGTSSKDCTWDLKVTYSTLTIDGGYAGTLSIGQASTLTLSGEYIALAAPSATTNPVTDNAANAATLNAIVNPHALETSAYFEWGTTAAYGNTTSTQVIPAGRNDVAITASISGLKANTLYHYRIVATNSLGTTDGDGESFTTPVSAPSTITNPITGHTGNIAIFNATVNPNGAETSVSFQ